MRELKYEEINAVSGGWNPDEEPDSRSLTIPTIPGMGTMGFDGSGDGSGSGQMGPPVSGTVTTEGGSNGVDDWTAEGSVDTDGDGQPDLSGSANSDGQWDAQYTFNNGTSVGVSNHTDAGANTPGNTGSFVTVSIPW